MKIQLDRRDATVIFLTLLLVLVPLTLVVGICTRNTSGPLTRLPRSLHAMRAWRDLFANKDNSAAGRRPG